MIFKQKIMICIENAATHNLKNISLQLPKNKLIVITGLSGSGKSSLAFDTLYAEGQRRYVESLSAYARQFLQLMPKPEVQSISGLSPAIAIEQKTASHNPRSTVGTVTEIHDYLRLLFARAGTACCPQHPQNILESKNISQILVEILQKIPENSKILLLSPIIRGKKGEFQNIFADLLKQGFLRIRFDNEILDLSEINADLKINKNKKHDLDVIIDRLKIKNKDDQNFCERLTQSLELAANKADGKIIIVNLENNQELFFSTKLACPTPGCDFALPELEPRLFSFNSPFGACPNCDGLGFSEFFDIEKIIADENLSLYDGAIYGWSKNSPYYFQMLESLAGHYNFSTRNDKFFSLPQKIKDILFHGSGEEIIKFKYHAENSFFGDAEKKNSKAVEIKNQTFPGILAILQKRYNSVKNSQSQSLIIKKENEYLHKFISQKTCPHCNGGRLNVSARNVKIGEFSLPELNNLALKDLYDFFANKLQLSGYKSQIAEKILQEILQRLKFLIDVGLEYLTLGRSAETLSGGESQRIRLASQIGSGLTGVMYVLDEPSIGLHQRDNQRLIQTLQNLRNLGNTLIVVEHDEEMIRTADFLVDIGVGAGIHGGEVIAAGFPRDLIKNFWKNQKNQKNQNQKLQQSLTLAYLNGDKKISTPSKNQRIPPDKNKFLSLFGASQNNLKNVNLHIPVGLFTCITGVSGSGKSTLINDTLFPAMKAIISNSANSANSANYKNLAKQLKFKDLRGAEFFDKIINIDQTPIGRTPRSNLATYVELLTPIRELFAQMPLSKERGYSVGRFSFNVKGGRCEVCQGDGLIKVAMHFLPDIFVPCDACNGKRYNAETLQVLYKGKSIADVLAMTVEEASEFFANVPSVQRKLQTLQQVGLAYISLGQSATTFSGGEAQRVKLALELSKRDTGKTLYILDEPTTGLHFHDVAMLLEVLKTLRDAGNTIVVIEHNLDVIKTADYIVDLGKEGGNSGGEIIAEGSPEVLFKKYANKNKSYTADFLQEVLSKK